MKKTSIRVRLRSFMELNELTAEDVSEMLDVSLSTVYMWRSKTGTEMPENLFELLRLKTERN